MNMGSFGCYTALGQVWGGGPGLAGWGVVGVVRVRGSASRAVMVAGVGR
jgi:hypothetical protein